MSLRRTCDQVNTVFQRGPRLRHSLSSRGGVDCPGVRHVRVHQPLEYRNKNVRFVVCCPPWAKSLSFAFRNQRWTCEFGNRKLADLVAALQASPKCGPGLSVHRRTDRRVPAELSPARISDDLQGQGSSARHPAWPLLCRLPRFRASPDFTAREKTSFGSSQISMLGLPAGSGSAHSCQPAEETPCTRSTQVAKMQARSVLGAMRSRAAGLQRRQRNREDSVMQGSLWQLASDLCGTFR